VSKLATYLIGVPITAAVILLPHLAIEGFVLMVLWNWFLVPLGLPALTFGLAVGVQIVMTMLQQRGPALPEGKKLLNEMFNFIIMRPLSCLVFGWLVKVVLL
jgi:hypothetical protein